MRKTIVTLLLGLTVAAAFPAVISQAEDVVGSSVEINEVNFPDEEFRGYVSDTYDTDADGVLSVKEIDAATRLNLEWSYVEDLAGIEKLTALKELNISCTYISEVDVTKNINLEVLDLKACYDIVNLNISNNKKLKYLDITQTLIDSLDTTNNTELVTLIAERTPIVTVDLSKNSKLEEVNFKNSKLKAVDFENLSELKSATVDMCPLKAIDVSKNLKLEKLMLSGNTGIESLSLSNNPALKILEISGTSISDLSLAENTLLEEFYNYSYKSSKLDHDTLFDKEVNILPAPIRILDLRACTNIKKVRLDESTITVKVSGSDPLSSFDMSSIVGADNITRVTIPSEDIEYDNTTGIATFKTENNTGFSYAYAADDAGKYVLNVNVSIEKKTADEETAEKAEADKAAAKSVTDKIAMIGTVTVNSESVITDARKAYDALTSDQKQYVKNYEMLTNAEKTLASLKSESVKAAEEEKQDKEIAKVKKGTVKTVKTKAGKKKAILKWKAASTPVDGYKVYRSTKKSSGFKAIKTVKSKKLTVKKLKKGKVYYFKIRGYKKINGKTVYTKYSKVVKVKVK